MILLISACAYLICSVECFPLEIHKSVDDYSVEGPREERASLETLWDDYGNRPSNGDDSSNKYVRDISVAETEPAEYTSSEYGKSNDEPEDKMGDDEESESERSTESLLQPKPTHELLTTFPEHLTVDGAPATEPGLDKFQLVDSGVGAHSSLDSANPLSSISYGPGGIPKAMKDTDATLAGTAGTGAVLLGSRLDSRNRAKAGSLPISHPTARLAPSTLSKHKEVTAISLAHTALTIAFEAKSSSKSGGSKAEERAVTSSNPIYVGRATFPLPAKSAAVGAGTKATALRGSGLKSSKAVNSGSVLKSRPSSKIGQTHESKSLYKRKADSGEVPVAAGEIGASDSGQGSTLKPDQKPSSVTKVLGNLFQSKSTGVVGAAGVGAGAGVGLASEGSPGSKSLSQPGTTVPPSPLAIPKAESAAAGSTVGGGAGAAAASPVSKPVGETPTDSDSSSSSSTLMLIIKGLVGVVGAAGAVSGVAYVVQKRKKEEPPVEEETPLLPQPPPKEKTPEPVVEEKVEPPPEPPPPEPKIEPPPPLPEPDEPVKPEEKPEPEGVSGDEEPPPPKPEPPQEDIEQLGLRLQESSSSDEDEDETAPPPEPEPAPVQPPPPEPEPVQPPPPEPPKPTTNWQPLRKPTSFHQQFGGT